MPLSEFVEDHIWLRDYPVRYAGCRFNARMSVIRLDDRRLMLHSPGPMDKAMQEDIARIGDVACIVAPGSFHYLYMPDAQRAFPDAETYICPGIEQKRPDIDFDWILGSKAPAPWAGVLDQVLIRGCRFMWEVVMCHRPTRTLLLVDSIENMTDDTPGVSWQLKTWFKYVFRMWNRPAPAPEYQLGWKDRKAARHSLETILSWDFDRIVLSHGDNIMVEAKKTARRAWRIEPARNDSP